MYLCPCRASHPFALLCRYSIACMVYLLLHPQLPSPFSACLSLSISVCPSLTLSFSSNGSAFIHSASVYTLLLLSMLSLLSLLNVCCFIYLFSPQTAFGKCSLGCDGFRPRLGGRIKTHFHKLLFGMLGCVYVCAICVSVAHGLSEQRKEINPKWDLTLLPFITYLPL